MSFTEMAFTPATGLRDKTTYITSPASEEDARAQVQDISDQLRDYINDTFLVELASVTSGSSGAEMIGSAAISGVEVSAGVSATTIRDQIVAVKEIADAASAGTLTPSSINNSNMFGSKVVPQSAIADNAIGATQLADNAVDTAAIVDNAVTQDKIADNAVGADQLANSAVDSAAIVDGAVTEAKIGAGAVTETKIGDASVTTNKLGLITKITFETGAYIERNTSDDTYTITEPGCSAIQLVGIKFGTAASIAGTYPKGTLYIQHQA